MARPIITHEAGFAPDEVAGAVDRIDHPDPRRAQALAVVRDLLGQDDVVGERGAQALDDQRAGGVVRLGHRLVAAP